MKIAVVCSDQGVRLPGTKGASLHLIAISRAFARLGHEVMVVGVEGHGPLPGDLNCLRFPHPGYAKGLEREKRKLQLVERIAAEAAEPLARFAADVLYERLSLFGTAGRRLATGAHAMHVLEVNALLAEEESRWRGLSHVEEAKGREGAVLRGAGLRVCVSCEMAESVERLAPGPPTIVVPNGVDTDLFAHLPTRPDARRRFGLPADAALVGFVGSLRPWHGLDLALDAMVELSGAVLVIAGDGPIRTDLERKAANLGISHRVHWLENLSHHLVADLLAGLDVAIAPYPRLEDFAFSPLKLFEYLAAGVPIVASDLGQIRTVLDGGRWGKLVTPGSPGALAAAIREILVDPEPARHRAEAARRHTREAHDWTARASDIVGAIGALSGAMEAATSG